MLGVLGVVHSVCGGYCRRDQVADDRNAAAAATHPISMRTAVTVSWNMHLDVPRE